MSLMQRKKTIVFSIAKAKDYYNNLVQILTKFQRRLRKLQQLRWQEKSPRLSLPLVIMTFFTKSWGYLAIKVPVISAF